MEISYYKLLGIEPTATLEEIKKAHKKKMLEYHPDKNGDSPLAKTLFLQIQEAEKVLSDSAKRQEHDYNIGVKQRPTPSPTIIEKRIPVPSENKSNRLNGVLVLFGLSIGVLATLFFASNSKK